MEFDISSLREQRRPLWMSYFGIESFAEFVGGGGDYQFDRMPMEWSRYIGLEDETLESKAAENKTISHVANSEERVNLTM
jgi:hypothetical protein